MRFTCWQSTVPALYTTVPWHVDSHIYISWSSRWVSLQRVGAKIKHNLRLPDLQFRDRGQVTVFPFLSCDSVVGRGTYGWFLRPCTICTLPKGLARHKPRCTCVCVPAGSGFWNNGRGGKCPHRLVRTLEFAPWLMAECDSVWTTTWWMSDFDWLVLRDGSSGAL